MSTINSRPLIDEIIKRNGRYGDDPVVVKIVKYTNAWGGTAYGIIHDGQDLEMYRESSYVINPITIWARNTMTGS